MMSGALDDAAREVEGYHAEKQVECYLAENFEQNNGIQNGNTDVLIGRIIEELQRILLPNLMSIASSYSRHLHQALNQSLTVTQLL